MWILYTSIEDIMIMFSKKTMSKELVKLFDDALRQVHESGEYQTIMDKNKR